MKIVVAAISIMLTTCSPSSGPLVTWEARCDELVPDKYQACYGPGWDHPGSDERPYENFQVSLERKYKAGSDVMVNRTFPAREVPAKLMIRNPPSVVTFDRTSGKVTYKVGAQTVIGYVP